MTEIDTRPPSARSRLRRPPRRQKGDLHAALAYTLSALTVRTMPQAAWTTAARGLSVVAPGSAARAARWPAYLNGLRAVLGESMPEAEVRALFDRGTRYRQHAELILAASRRRRDWNPAIVLDGEERLAAALARGRGAILWFDDLPHTPIPLVSIPGKRALAEAGHRIWHLSGYAHGFSYSRFSARHLNWRLIETERRYLAGRLVFSEDSVVSATRQIVALLAENAIVGIANNAVMGKTVQVPFADAALTIAPAPLSIAVRRGAALLPVAVIEAEPFARYEVRIGEEIVPPAPGTRADPVGDMAAAYARYLLPIVRARPDLFDWSRLAGPAGRAPS